MAFSDRMQKQVCLHFQGLEKCCNFQETRSPVEAVDIQMDVASSSIVLLEQQLSGVRFSVSIGNIRNHFRNCFGIFEISLFVCPFLQLSLVWSLRKEEEVAKDEQRESKSLNAA